MVRLTALQKPTSELGEQQVPREREKSSRSNSVRVISIILGLFTTPLVLFSLIQYSSYSFDLFLGWDTSTYVWWAELFRNEGTSFIVQNSYPNLYVVILTGFGTLVGQVSLAEKILPFIVALPLAYACYRLTLDITSDKTLGYVAALVGGLTINTLRLESDLHRNLLSFAVSMVLGALVSAQLRNPKFSFRNQWKRVFLVWLPLLALVAYTQLETYLVLSISLIMLFAYTRKRLLTLEGTLLVALPVIISLPLISPFLLSYSGSVGLIGLGSQPPISIITEAFLYLGGFAVVWTIAGLVLILEKARAGSQSALFVLMWLGTLALLFPVATLIGLPYDRFLYVVPIPIIVASGAKEVLNIGSVLSRVGWLRTHVTKIRVKTLWKNLFPTALGLLLIALLVTSSTSGSFLRPYVSQQDVDRLDQVASLVQQYGYSQPILVMYGPVASDLNTIYRAYFGIEIPNNFAYYGKLQYLFTLPEPSSVYTWQFDPSFELATSTRYRTELLTKLGSASAISSHAIIIAGANIYDRPLSETFLTQYETAPGSGIYIIPPNQLTANQTNLWRLFAYSDWSTKPDGSTVNATWAQASKELSYVQKGSKASFDANYTISLSQSWSKMEFTLRLFNWMQPFTFPDASTAPLAPVQITFDNQVILSYNYTGLQGPLTLNAPLTNVSSGLHTFRISSTSSSAAMAVAVDLDTIQVCPNQCA